MKVYVGNVEVWDVDISPREQAVKMCEEVMEVFAIIDQNGVDPVTTNDIYRECADVITATCNLIAMLDRIFWSNLDVPYDESIPVVFASQMKLCADAQRERGRI